MGIFKHFIPYALLWLYDANYGHMAPESYLVAVLLIVFVDARSHLSGYRLGFHSAERIGTTILVHLTKELGETTVLAAMKKIKEKQ